MISVQLLTGIRLSELRALRKEDLDLQAPGLRVRRAQARTEVTTPKNKRARFQPIPRPLADELRRWMLRVEGQLLFPGPSGGPLPNNTLNWCYPSSPTKLAYAARDLLARNVHANKPSLRWSDSAYANLAAGKA